MATQRFKFQRSSSSQSIPPLAKRVPTYRNRRKRIFADYNSHQLFSVRVVEVPGVSMKLCGGTHVRNTFEICGFKIISEQGIASGIRRIEAVTGDAFIKYVSARDNYMKQLCSTLKDASFVPYNNFNPLMAEGMNGPEATHKLNPLDEKANVNSAIYPMVTNFEWRSDISQHSTVSTPNSLGPAFLRPSEKPNLLGAPSRRDVSLSESDPDVKKRIHMMNHKQDLRYRDSGDPPLLSRFPGQQSVLGIQPVGGRLAEEDIKKRRIGNQPSEIIQGSDLSKPDRPRAQQNSIVNSASSSLAVDYSSHLPKSEEAYHGHEVQKQNLPSTTQTSGLRKN